MNKKRLFLLCLLTAVFLIIIGSSVIFCLLDAKEEAYIFSGDGGLANLVFPFAIVSYIPLIAAEMIIYLSLMHIISDKIKNKLTNELNVIRLVLAALTIVSKLLNLVFDELVLVIPWLFIMAIFASVSCTCYKISNMCKYKKGL